MSAEYSESLNLIWRIAELHARKQNSEKVEPYHLFLALTKCVDLDLTTLVPKDVATHDEVLEELLREIRRIRLVFESVNFDAKKFRRNLRHTIPKNRTAWCDSFLHRSASSKLIFKNAEKVASITKGATYPIHLLWSILQESCSYSDSVMIEISFKKEKLLKILNNQILTRSISFKYTRLNGEN